MLLGKNIRYGFCLFGLLLRILFCLLFSSPSCWCIPSGLWLLTLRVVRKAFRAIRMVRTFRLFKGSNDGCGRGGSPKSYEAIGQGGRCFHCLWWRCKILGKFSDFSPLHPRNLVTGLQLLVKACTCFLPSLGWSMVLLGVFMHLVLDLLVAAVASTSLPCIRSH